MAEQIFYGISMILGVVLVSLGITRVLKQPLIIGYIVAGILSAIFFPQLLHGNHALESFSSIGISLLLFIVGMELHPKIIKDIGKTSIIAGSFQVIITAALGFGISLLIGMDPITAGYIGIGSAFSSTIVILKLLDDIGKTESTFGRLSIGILIIQDIIVMILFMLLGALQNIGGGSGGREIALTLFLKIIGIGASIFVVSKYLIPRVTNAIAKSKEFLFLFAIGRCFILGSLFYKLGFGMEIGALIAGITLATSAYRFEITSKIKSLRDFFIVMFFVLLGSHVHFTTDIMFYVKVLILSGFILVIKPIITDIILGIMGHTRKNSFLAGASLGQISEFSFLLITMGIAKGMIGDPELLSLVTLTGLVTITISSYYILYGEKRYPKIRKYLGILPGKRHKNYKKGKESKAEIILFGYGKFGNKLYDSLRQKSKHILVIDENPSIISHLEENKIKNRYGDAGDLEFLKDLNLSDTKMIISTVKDYEDNLILVEYIKNSQKYLKDIILILMSHQAEEALDLYDRGANHVILPHYIGANHTSLLLEEYGLNVTKFVENKKQEMDRLKNRQKDLLIEALLKI
ncbi:MAG TPA: cation:proton antiporter [Candidatus Absconditabacterales bacterium]|nr:cation:proton antiporter [Candidatus Absconditabacterales bacterium]